MGTIHYTIGKPIRKDEDGWPTLYEVERVEVIGTASGKVYDRRRAYHLKWNDRYGQYNITIARNENFGEEVGWIKSCRDSNRKGDWVARQSYDLDDIAPGELIWGDSMSHALNKFLR